MLLFHLSSIIPHSVWRPLEQPQYKISQEHAPLITFPSAKIRVPELIYPTIERLGRVSSNYAIYLIAFYLIALSLS